MSPMTVFARFLIPLGLVALVALGTVSSTDIWSVQLAVHAVFGPSDAGIGQPLAFPHAVHLDPDRVGLACENCHQQVFDGPQAGRPPDWLCLSCHPAMDIGPMSPAIETLLTYAERGDRVPWRRVWGLPAEIHFSHRTHAVVAGIECETCHGAVSDLMEPLSRPLKTLDMAACIGCHETWTGPVSPVSAAAPAGPHGGRGPVTTDCNACHR